jgi:hypothetical protein
MSAVGPETLLSQLKWRYANKQFDPTRKIDPETWAALVRCGLSRFAKGFT